MENGEPEKVAPASFSSANPAKKKIDKLIASKVHNDPVSDVPYPFWRIEIILLTKNRSK